MHESPKHEHHYPTRINQQELLAQTLCIDNAIELLKSHVRDNEGNKLSIRKLQKGPIGDIWDKALANEWGRLLPNGVGKLCSSKECIKGTGKFFFMNKQDIPKDCKISYNNFICDLRLHREEIYCVCLTAGGNKLDRFEETGAPTISLLDIKIHLNSTIPDAYIKEPDICRWILKIFILKRQ